MMSARPGAKSPSVWRAGVSTVLQAYPDLKPGTQAFGKSAPLPGRSERPVRLSWHRSKCSKSENFLFGFLRFCKFCSDLATFGTPAELDVPGKIPVNLRFCQYYSELANLETIAELGVRRQLSGHLRYFDFHPNLANFGTSS